MKHLISMLVLPLLALVATPAAATIMIKMELPQLVGRADVIFVGKVTKLESHWGEDGKHIVTDATFQVVQNVRGANITQPVVIRTMGGVVNGVGMKVFGAPQFAVGQEALLFTEARAGRRWVTGLTQGVYHVARDKSGRAQVHNTSAGLTLARRDRSGGLHTVQEPAPGPEALESFVTRIQQTIATCAREKSRCQDQ